MPKSKHDGNPTPSSQAPPSAFGEQHTVRMTGIEVPTSPSQGRLAALDESWLQDELLQSIDDQHSAVSSKPHVPYPTPPPTKWGAQSSAPNASPSSSNAPPPVSRSLYPTPARPSNPLAPSASYDPQQTTGTLPGLATDQQSTANLQGIEDPQSTANLQGIEDQQDTENLPGLEVPHQHTSAHQETDAIPVQLEQSYLLSDDLEQTLSSEIQPAARLRPTSRREEATAIFTGLETLAASETPVASAPKEPPIQAEPPPPIAQPSEEVPPVEPPKHSNADQPTHYASSPHYASRSSSSLPQAPSPSSPSLPSASSPYNQEASRRDRTFESFMLYGGLGIFFALILVWSLLIFASLLPTSKKPQHKASAQKTQQTKK
ncbi:MAG: hypothetical protein H6727_18770 [Myxococcales bacterium]|nr:hypothetical protein [Myxococcales bacterium]